MGFQNTIKISGNEEFNKFLQEIYVELVKIFKNEELVYEALYNTEIVSVKNIYEYLREKELLENEDSLVTDDDLKRSAGVYHSSPKISFVNGRYELTGINRVVAIVDLDLNNASSKASLIHELLHLIKSYYNEYIVEGNNLTCYSGLITSTYELSFDGEKVTKKLINETGVGLEEGLTSIQEELISRKIVDSEYKACGYGPVYSIAETLLEIFNVEDAVINAEIYHDKSELYSSLGMDNYQALESLGDRIYELNLKMFSESMELSTMLETKDTIIRLLNEEYAPLIDKMKSNLKRS